MTKNKKVLIGKMACILSVIPALIYAHEFGPDPGFTNAPGDNKTSCINTGCHVGTVNQFTGSVKVTAASGSSYTPGQTQVLTVTIADPAQKGAGFEMTARLTSNATAGDLNTADNLTQVICADASNKTAGKACPAQFPTQYAEHNLNGWSASRSSAGSYSYKVNWTAPAAGSGTVTFYVAGNASSNGSTDQNSGHIYNSTLTLTEASATTGTKPAITSSGGVVNGATNLAGGVAPNTYITIFGTNLATNSRTWTGSDFGSSGITLPTALDGTSVMINGKPAYVEYISPTQINAITPADTSSGSGINVTVTTAGGTSDASSVTLNTIAPGFFTFDGKYVAAADASTGAFIGKTGLLASAPTLTTPAKPGEIITLYGTGFGATSPAIAPGIVTDKIYNLSPTPVIMVGGSAAAVGFAALTPGFAQVYQFNITIPATAPDGDLQIFAQTGSGPSSPSGTTCCFVTVKK